MAFDFTEALTQAGMTEEAAGALSAAVGAGTPVFVAASALAEGSGFGMSATLPDALGPLRLCDPAADEGGFFMTAVPTLWDSVTVSAIVEASSGSGNVVLRSGLAGAQGSPFTVTGVGSHQEVELVTGSPVAYADDMGGLLVAFQRVGTAVADTLASDLIVVGFTIRAAT